MEAHGPRAVAAPGRCARSALATARPAALPWDSRKTCSRADCLRPRVRGGLHDWTRQAWAPHTATYGLEGADISAISPGLVDDTHGAHVVDACRRTACEAPTPRTRTWVEADLIEQREAARSGFSVQGLHLRLDVGRGHLCTLRSGHRAPSRHWPCACGGRCTAWRLPALRWRRGVWATDGVEGDRQQRYHERALNDVLGEGRCRQARRMEGAGEGGDLSQMHRGAHTWRWRGRRTCSVPAPAAHWPPPPARASSMARAVGWAELGVPGDPCGSGSRPQAWPRSQSPAAAQSGLQVNRNCAALMEMADR